MIVDHPGTYISVYVIYPYFLSFGAWVTTGILVRTLVGGAAIRKITSFL